ncbi:MAG TPA: hypothetical protein VFI02_01340 [Armatimonadota bacterium]|nr:hypothetical protein [Armatimonadota bacterium]
MRILTLLATAILITNLANAEVTQDMKINPRPKEPHTSFQSGSAYRPELDIRTDAVIHYGCTEKGIQSWLDKGYVVQTMYGFRTGQDYIKEHADEGQTDANGTILTCGPGSYYMVPTQARIDAALDYYRQAITNGTSMAVPEEPEFFIRSGYSESFKREWQDYYHEPWQDQATSVEARWKSSRLKGYLEYRMVKSILEDAQKQKPEVIRAVAGHSAVSYYQWGIIYPHYEVMKLPALQEMIGQVWTGTARSACKYEGVSAERTFENGFLEYSSLYNLTRGTGKRLWFLMDPLEDNPDRSMEDYQINYIKTLVASLMFPEVDEFEVMPWPERIFGRVPDGFATTTMSIVTMLGDIHNQKGAKLDGGTRGIATFVADSMAWQRGDPHASDYDCFYGLTLPLIMKGIPVQVAQLERVSEAKYLDAYKVLLVSFDIMKPMDEAYNLALVDWVKKGGALVLFGGEDAYNALPEWWQKAGFKSPHEHLLANLGDPPLFGRELNSLPVGKGTVIVVGKPPSYFASSKESADELRAIVARACEAAGIKYREQHYMKVRRGRYVAVRAFDEPVTVKGKFVDVLDPELPLLTNPTTPAQELGVMADVAKLMADSKPRILLSSSRIEASSETATETKVLLSGPLKTKGVVRFSTAGKKVKSVTVQDTTGKPVEREWGKAGDTLFIKHDGLPEGVLVRVEWD